MKKPDPKIIVALDFPDKKSALNLVSQLNPALCRLKVGNILFTHYGPSFVEALMKQGFQVFLDLKFHDIPQTVAGACREAALLNIWMVNLHIMGGATMLKAARKALDELNQPKKPLLIGVTILTSLDNQDIKKIGFQKTIPELVTQFAKEAEMGGLDGIVCSSQEINLLRSQLSEKFIFVTPGIRLEKNPKEDDQKRTMTPKEAIQAGATYLVIGRPITQSLDPLKTLEAINQAIK